MSRRTSKQPLSVVEPSGSKLAADPVVGDTRHGRAWTGDVPVRLSMLMPVFNEERTIETAIRAIVAADYPCPTELIVVDDGSTDRTPEILAALDEPEVRVQTHPTNLGKGAALQTAAAVARGSHIVPFDADLEYSADDLAALVEPVIEGKYDVVYGTRLFGVNTMYQSYKHAMGNRGLTLVANLLFDSYLSDIHTCLKLMPLELFQAMDLRENGFGLDTEITANILKHGVRPFEVPVTYHSRSPELGKKISSLHGLECLRVMLRVRFARQQPRVADPVSLSEARIRTAHRTGRFDRRRAAQDEDEAPVRRSAAG